MPTISASWPVAPLATRTIFGYRPAPAVPLALLLVPLLVAGCGSTSPWRTVNSPTTWGLSSIAMVSASDGWAVGSGPNSTSSTILHYANGQWRTVSSPTSNTLDSIAMVSASDGWAVGDNGTILHYAGRQ